MRKKAAILVVFVAVLATFLLIGCRQTQSPPGQSTETFTSDRGTYTVEYEESYSPQIVTRGRVAFTDAAFRTDGDEVAPITFFELPLSLSEATELATSLFETGFTTQEVEVAARTGVKVTGTLSQNTFGWGGLPHTFVLVPYADGVLQIQYDSADQNITSDVEAMLQTVEIYE